MEAKTLELKKLIDYAKMDTSGASLKGNSSEGKTYGKLVADICQNISDDQGIYIWGRYQNNGSWQTLYLGKSGSGKTSSLRARLTEELKDERAFLWGDDCAERTDDIIKLWIDHYPEKDGTKKSMNHVTRSLSKMGATHIIWVTSPELDNKQVTTIEADLIETLNPVVNVQRPKPCGSLQSYTVSVIGKLKEEIHKHR